MRVFSLPVAVTAAPSSLGLFLQHLTFARLRCPLHLGPQTSLSPRRPQAWPGQTRGFPSFQETRSPSHGEDVLPRTRDRPRSQVDPSASWRVARIQPFSMTRSGTVPAQVLPVSPWDSGDDAVGWLRCTLSVHLSLFSSILRSTFYCDPPFSPSGETEAQVIR